MQKTYVSTVQLAAAAAHGSFFIFISNEVGLRIVSYDDQTGNKQTVYWMTNTNSIIKTTYRTYSTEAENNTKQ